jgi:hypothetical protein
MGWVKTKAAEMLLPATFAVCCILWFPAIMADHKFADHCISDAAVRESGSLTLAWLRTVYAGQSAFWANWMLVLALIGHWAIPIVAAVQRRFQFGVYLSIALAAIIWGQYCDFVVYSHTEHMDKYTYPPLIAGLAICVTAFFPVAVYAAVAAVRQGLRTAPDGIDAGKSGRGGAV